ncbi:hypothetical protein HKX48_003043 [Thoreauomyces humboldtii]|nr:hypothetical protein HKX48_003043 [Thoreauomyces humboldtii]
MAPWLDLRTFPVFDEDVLGASAVTEAAKAGILGAFAGSVGAGAFGWWIASPREQVLREMGRSGAFFAAASGAFYGTKTVVGQLRNKDDMWNAPAGGLVAGVLLGLRAGKANSVLAHAVFLPLVIGTAEWANRAMPSTVVKPTSEKHDPDFFKWPRRDPFAERWAEIQKRDAEKSS